MKPVLPLTFWMTLFSPVVLHAQLFTLGSTLGSWPLPAGYSYSAVEAWVTPGQTQGLPYVLATPVGSSREAGLFVSHEGASGMEFGAYTPAISLLEHETGSSVGTTVIANDLKRMPDGSPLIIGASRSPRTTINGFESTIWEMDNSHVGLNPVALGFLALNANSILIGGNSIEGYSGSTTVFPAYIPPTGGGQTLPVPPPGGGAALDLDGNTIVGEADFHGFFFTKTQSGAWAPGNLQLPDWSDGAGTVSDVIGNIMGGYLYNPNLDDVVPVLWNTDGSINKIFDLPGYNVTELILDQGTVVALLNQGEGANVFGESRLYAEGWADSRFVYGDILPALPAGTSATVRDISAGGSLWVLGQFETSSIIHYEALSVLSTVSVIGDYNTDGIVNGDDFLVWRQHFGFTVVAGEGADGNQNATIDAADYVVWRKNLGGGLSGGTTVPEPGVIVMLVCYFFMGRSFRRLSD